MSKTLTRSVLTLMSVAATVMLSPAAQAQQKFVTIGTGVSFEHPALHCILADLADAEAVALSMPPVPMARAAWDAGGPSLVSANVPASVTAGVPVAMSASFAADLSDPADLSAAANALTADHPDKLTMFSADLGPSAFSDRPATRDVGPFPSQAQASHQGPQCVAALLRDEPDQADPPRIRRADRRDGCRFPGNLERHAAGFGDRRVGLGAGQDCGISAVARAPVIFPAFQAIAIRSKDARTSKMHQEHRL